jgi:hypothetical protein
MLKVLIISSQLIGLLFINVFYSPKEVQLTHDLPSTTIIGAEHWVYVTIDKNKLGGFAKLQVDVPEGMQVEPGDLRGASFTFAEGAAKIIWMSLPPESEFEISYKLIIYDDCQVGNNIIQQKFAYLEKNERKVLQVDDHIVFVESENLSNEYVPDTLANGSRTITKLNDDHYLIEIDLYKDGIKGFAKIEEFIPAGMNAEAVNKSRSVFTQIDNKVKFVWFSIPEEERISLTYELFSDGPIDETVFVDSKLPITGEFTYLRNNESRTIAMRTADNGAELVDVESTETESPDLVVDIPDVDTLETPDLVAETPEKDPVEIPVIDPVETNDLVEETPVLAPIETQDTTEETPEVDPIETPDILVENPEAASIEAPDMAEETSEIDPIESPDLIAETPEAETPDLVLETPDSNEIEPIIEEIEAVAETTYVAVDEQAENFETVSNFPSPDKGVSYRVQIMAGKNVVGEEYLKKRHRFSDDFTIEHHNVWVKYTTGIFGIYKEARDKRNHITDNYNFDGPFVTAYNEGSRITVQEALMISSQKWYQ